MNIYFFQREVEKYKKGVQRYESELFGIILH